MLHFDLYKNEFFKEFGQKERENEKVICYGFVTFRDLEVTN